MHIVHLKEARRVKKQKQNQEKTHKGQMKSKMKNQVISFPFLLCLLLGLQFIPHPCVDGLSSDNLCKQCATVVGHKCPSSSAFPHMTAYDDRLIAGALQSDLVDANDRGVYSVLNVEGGKSRRYNAYFGWRSDSGSVSGYHRFSNYMDKCSGGQSYLTVDKVGKVALRSLKSLESLADADWKSINPPKKVNHRGYRFWLSGSSGKCLTVLGGHGMKRTVGVADCKFDGSNTKQLFAFRFHYHLAFCSCGVFNN